MNRLKRRWTLLTAGMLAWSVFGVVPADAQIYPNFRPSMPMISPIGPRDPGMHTQPGNISNIPMGGSTATGTSSDQTGRRTIKKIKQVIPRDASTTKITRQVNTTSGGGRGTGSSGAGGGGSGIRGRAKPGLCKTRSSPYYPATRAPKRSIRWCGAIVSSCLID